MCFCGSLYCTQKKFFKTAAVRISISHLVAGVGGNFLFMPFESFFLLNNIVIH